MTGPLIFGVFFLWIVALKTVATCDHRSIPLVSSGILAVCIAVLSHLGGAPLITTLAFTAGFFLLALSALWLLQQSNGIIVYLFIAVLSTGALFVGLPTLADWIQSDPVTTEDANED